MVDRRTGDESRHGYDGQDRRSWKDEANDLHRRLESIESLVRDNQQLARATHDSMVTHVAEDRETRAAIDELILLWRGSKLMVAALKFSIPIVAALVAVLMWAKDHYK